MPRLAENDKDPELNARFKDDEREFETFKQGLRKLVAYYRDKLAKAETAGGVGRQVTPELGTAPEQSD